MEIYDFEELVNYSSRNGVCNSTAQCGCTVCNTVPQCCCGQCTTNNTPKCGCSC